MTGRLQILRRMLAAHGNDLMGGTAEERDVATTIRALHTAIALEATAELAALVKPWMDGKIVAVMQAGELDDQTREDVIAALRGDAKA